MPLSEIIPLLSPEHRYILETLARDYAKLEGIEAPAGSKTQNLSDYISAWQNSLGNRSFSPGSMELYRINVGRFFANVPPPISTISIEGYLASRSPKLSPNALKNDLKAIKSFFGFLYDRDIITSDPAAKIEHPRIVKREKECPTEDEMAKFLAVLAKTKNSRAKLMLFLFMNTGIRFTELVTLPWGRVNLEECEITVLGKGGKVRRVPMATWLGDFLADHRNGQADSELLFPTESKKGKWDNSDANKMIARLCRRARIKRYTCHQFRHYFATYTLKGTGEKGLKAVQEMLGHASAAITLDFYVHTDEEEIREMHERFAPLSEKGTIPRKDKGGGTHGRTN